MSSDDGRYLLVVEDNPADVRVIERVFNGQEHPFSLHVINTGTKALDFLRTDFGEYQLPPALVLLDLNLPGADGETILTSMKDDDRFQRIPVVILTTSDKPEDRDLCYEAGANSYVVKPKDSKVYRQRLKQIEEYWFETVSLPGNPS